VILTTLQRRYTYHKRGTKFYHRECTLPRDEHGKCIRSRMGTVLADFGGEKAVIAGRFLRIVKVETSDGSARKAVT